MRVIAKNILLILLPLLLILGVYLLCDPFEVIYGYQQHYNDPRINYNWDFNQTETLLRNYEKRRYDSFIFGNSRSTAFFTSDWSRASGAERPLHYGAMNESLYGIHGKLRLLADRWMPVKHALLVLDSQTLQTVTNSSGHLFRKHPLISGESCSDFHLLFFRAFMELPYFAGYLEHRLTGRVSPLFQKNFGLSLRYDPVTGDKFQDILEKSIAENSEKYYKDRSAIFYDRALTRTAVSAPVIKGPQLVMLEEIKAFFEKNRTDYRIVISPNYDQKRFNSSDLLRLQTVFGADTVYDFSGVNRLTAETGNYYEDSHYRPLVARQILEEIYKTKEGGRDGR